jgi:hypothetical protein
MITYTAGYGAWARFGWVALWGAIASVAAYLGDNLPAVAGSLSEQAWWPVIVPALTAAIAAITKYATEKRKGN